MSIDSDHRLKRLAIDVRAAQDLRGQMKQDPQAALKSAAQQFEAMFMQMVLKSMRDATPQDGLLSSDQGRLYTEMLDKQMAMNMATSGKGMGLARIIEQQLGRNLPQHAADAPGNAATPLPPPPAAPAASDASRAVHPLLDLLYGTGSPANAAAASTGNNLPLTTSSPRHLMPAAPATPSSAVAPVEPRTTGAVAGDGLSNPAREFVARVWPHAVEASRSTGIPPQFLVAHAALESGWGKHEIRRADGTTTFNLFGIKAGKSWAGDSVAVGTTEFVDGEAQRVTGKFRAYASYADAFRDYAALLRNNPRYGAVIGSQDGIEFARRLQQAGYATDPHYADKLARIINGPTLRSALIG